MNATQTRRFLPQCLVPVVLVAVLFVTGHQPATQKLANDPGVGPVQLKTSSLPPVQVG